MLTSEPRVAASGQPFEQMALDTLKQERGLFRPLDIRSLELDQTSGRTLISLGWQGRESRFWLEVKARTAPKVVQEAFWKLKGLTDEERRAFLLVVPYITTSIREMVERERVSCIDLNGNYLIQSPGLLAIRLDRKNRFPESASIKKIFSGNSSQVGRLFLTEKRTYESVSEVYGAIGRLGGGLSLSAISKVLQGLQDELMIEKSSKRIALLQPEKLLSRLQAEYVPPKPLAQLKLKIPGKGKELLKTIATKLSRTTWMLSGESSVEKFAATTTPSILRVYSVQAGALEKFEDSRFYNVVFEGTAEPYVYFGRELSSKDKVCWASRLQTYFELARMDKRERELAEAIRDEILKEFK